MTKIQPVKGSPKLPEPSAPARLEVTFQWERLRPNVKEFPPLFNTHWRELALDQDAIPLDPNWDLYLQADLAGVLWVLTARFGKLLVGYVFTFAGPGLHYQGTTLADVDMFWLDPAFRAGWTGVKLILENERKMRELKVKKITISEKIHFHNWQDRRVGLLFKRLGYTPIEVKYAKTLEPLP